MFTVKQQVVLGNGLKREFTSNEKTCVLHVRAGAKNVRVTFRREGEVLKIKRWKARTGK